MAWRDAISHRWAPTDADGRGLTEHPSGTRYEEAVVPAIPPGVQAWPDFRYALQADPTRLPLPFVLGCAWLLFAGALMVVYRGITQSLTIDEAYTYHLFLNRKIAVLFTSYDAAYHVLHTWATWLVVHRFGKSEAVMRLPSMVAGLFYLAGAGVLCRQILGDGWRFLVGVILFSANPLVVDYLSAARGYGAALAFFVWAFVALLRQRPTRASALLALSVACNLTFLVPAVSVGAVYLASQARPAGEMVPLLRRLVLPFLAVAVPILAIPLSHARGFHLYFGAADVTTSVNTLIQPSLAHGSPTAPAWVGTVTRSAMPLMGTVVVLAGLMAARQRATRAMLPVGALVISVLLLLGGHVFLGVLYPWSRTGLYLIWLFLASCIALWGWAARGRGLRHRGLSVVFGSVSVLLAIVFVAQLDTRYYYDFRDDARVNVLMRYLSAIDPGQPACIGGSWRFEPTVNYYRLRFRLTWIAEMQRTDEPQSGCRFYILAAEDRRFMDRLGLRPLWRDPLSGAVLAEAAGVKPRSAATIASFFTASAGKPPPSLSLLLRAPL